MPYSSWRLYIALCTIPTLSSGITFLLMPESPRFLMDQGRTEEALKVFQRIYKSNNSSSQSDFPVMNLECQSQKIPSSLPNTTNANVKTIVKRCCKPLSALFMPPLVLVTFIMCFIFFGVIFGVDGMGNWFPEIFNRMEKLGGSPCSKGNVNITLIFSDDTSNTCDGTVSNTIYLDTFLVSVSLLPGMVLSVVLMDRLGRKALLASSMTFSAISVFCLLFLNLQPVIMELYNTHLTMHQKQTLLLFSLYCLSP